MGLELDSLLAEFKEHGNTKRLCPTLQIKENYRLSIAPLQQTNKCIDLFFGNHTSLERWSVQANKS